jgi:hypothetical protein
MATTRPLRAKLWLPTVPTVPQAKPWLPMVLTTQANPAADGSDHLVKPWPKVVVTV